MQKRKLYFYIYYFSSLILLDVLALFAFLYYKENNFFQVVFFDVGQGDAIFIETPQKHQILIDGGPDSKILEKLSKEIPFWDRKIDLIILTHPERDHLNGLLQVLKKYEVENILWTGIKRETNEWKEWENAILKEKARIIIAQAGQQLIAGMANFKILFPLENLNDKEFKNTNDTSIVIQLVYQKMSFLLMGDSSQIVEKELISQNENLNSDVLKVGHHGSKTSSSNDFIERVSPALAVISVGKDNSYGHPHQEVLEILKKYGIKVLRTDLKGDIKIVSDGEKFQIQ